MAPALESTTDRKKTTRDTATASARHSSYCPSRLSDENRQLVATLGHELRNPLGTLQSVLEILTQEPEDPQVRHRLYSVLQRQVHHLDRLVQDLIESAHSPSHVLAMQWEPLDLVELVVEVVEAQRPQIVRDDRKLELATADGPVWVQGDPVRLSQVVRNLLCNAHRFTEPGGTIRVRVDSSRGDQARLRVLDDGVGLDPEHVEAIFEPFQRSLEPAPNDPLRTADGGLGLGLTIVRRLVEAHGGKVQARSEGHGHGVEMEVLLPLYGGGGATS